MTWFKQAILPGEFQRCEINTIRRVIIKVPGNVEGSDRYQHIRLAPSKKLEVVVSSMRQNIETFAEPRIKRISEAAEKYLKPSKLL